MLETSPVGVDTAAPAGNLTASLQSEITQLRARVESREQRIRILEEALRVLNSNKYGPSRERLSVAAGQNELFNEAEVILELCEATGVEPELKATPLREAKVSRGKPGRTKLADHLPRVEVRHELPESERHCDCGGTLVEIGADSSEQIDFIPAKVQVLHHLRIKYACPGCRQCIKSAPLPAHILPKTNASPGLLAYLVTSKYVDSLPLYRLEKMLERQEVRVPRSTQALWMIALTLPLQPLLNLMDERLRGSGYGPAERQGAECIALDVGPGSGT
jgi:transposase